jgi:myo-inositol 2-dehydrogenase/D-chiro-inositol 1-dehydrogenase
VRIGVIGVGRIGSFHARTLSDHTDVKEVVVADTDVARATNVSTEIGARAAPSLDALFDSVDAVVIAAPTSEHAALIRRAVDAELPAFCEKPIALDLESTRDVVDHVRRRSGIVQMGFQRRFDEGFLRARAAVAEGLVGKLYVVRMAGHDPEPPHESYVPTSGGIFRDLHIHDFDIARFVTSQEVTEVYADGGVLGFEFFAKYDDVDTAVAVLRFSEGAFGILSGARHDPLGYDIRMELFGSRDSIAVGVNDRMPLRSVEEGMKAPKGAYANFLDRFAIAYRKELDVFMDVATKRVANPCPPEDALEAMRVAVACDISRHEHRPVSLREVA